MRFGAWLWPRLLVWAPMVVWFAAFKPGIMSADSLVIWQMATEGSWVDLHPPVYTVGMWLSAELVGSPSLLALGQAFVLAAGIASVAQSAIRFGAPRRAVLATTALVALSPMVGGFAVSLWKDVPYSGLVLLLVARTIDFVGSRLAAAPEGENRALWLMVPVVVGLVALRQNGLVLVVAAVVILAIACRDRWRPLLGIAAIAAVSLAGLKVVVYPIAGVEPAEARFAIGPFLADIAAVAYAQPDLISDADERTIEEVAPVEVWAEGFIRYGGCQSLNWQHEHAQFDWSVVNDDPDAFRDIALRLAAETPSRVLGNHLCQGAVAFRPDPKGTLYTVSRGIDANRFGLATTPVSDRLHELAVDALDFSDRRSVQWLLWRAPLWIYLAIGALAYAARRSGRPLLLVLAAPLVAQQLSVLVINFAQDARYMMASLIAAPILATFGWWRSGADGAEETRLTNITVGAADR